MFWVKGVTQQYTGVTWNVWLSWVLLCLVSAFIGSLVKVDASLATVWWRILSLTHCLPCIVCLSACFPPLSPAALPVVFSAVEAPQNTRFCGEGVSSAPLAVWRHWDKCTFSGFEKYLHWVAINHFGDLVFYEMSLLEGFLKGCWWMWTSVVSHVNRHAQTG